MQLAISDTILRLDYAKEQIMLLSRECNVLQKQLDTLIAINESTPVNTINEKLQRKRKLH